MTETLTYGERAAAYGDVVPRPVVELDAVDTLAFGEADIPDIRRQDDWTLDSVDRLNAHTRQMRQYVATLQTEGLGWWGASSGGGYGPEAVEAFTRGEAFTLKGDEVIVHLPAVDVALLRRESGLSAPDSHGGRVGSAHMYSDWLQAARITAPSDDDAFGEDGMLAWESLCDYDADDDTESMEAWWE